MQLSVDELRGEIVGSRKEMLTPYGRRRITYADFTASGRTVAFIEKYLLSLGESYANSHTEDSYTGKTMTTYVHQAEARVKELLNATQDDYIIPVGTGSTGAIQKFCEILGLYVPPKTADYLKGPLGEYTRDVPVVFIGPYEHHSNDLIWRESIAEVVTVDLDKDGGIDLADLEIKLSLPKYRNRLKIGSFSAASNVSGVISPVYDIAKILHENHALACFDFAASGPYVSIDMNRDSESYFDAVYLSPHKFLGGPGACGLLVINKKLYDGGVSPTVAGGGTVDYVSAFGYDFTEDPESREKAGTPGIFQILKMALALELKAAIGIETIETIEQAHIRHVIHRLQKNPNIEILGPDDPDRRVAILSFSVRYREGYLHHRLVARLLNDLFGIQSRAGCACAGPYGHRLLGIDRRTSEVFREFISNGMNSLKPGWVRVNFHYTMTTEQVAFICDAIEFVAEHGYLFLQDYILDSRSGAWTYHDPKRQADAEPFGLAACLRQKNEEWPKPSENSSEGEYAAYLNAAQALALELQQTYKEDFASYRDNVMEEKKWFYVQQLV